MIVEKYDYKKHVDLTNIRTVVSRLNELAVETKRRPIEQAEHIYRMGVLLNNMREQQKLKKNDTAAISIRELGKLVGISHVTLSMAKTIAIRFDNDVDKFKEAFKGSTSWNSFMERFRPREKKPYADRLKQLRKTIIAIVEEYKEDKSIKKIYDYLDDIRRVIERHVPITEGMADEVYLKYYDCCCCGDTALPDGNEVVTMKGVRHVYYPRCKRCEEQGVEPDPWMIATMYASHAIMLEQAIVRLKDGMRSRL